MQHLDLTLRTMADVEGQATIVQSKRAFAVAVGKLFGASPGHCGIAQFEDIRL